MTETSKVYNEFIADPENVAYIASQVFEDRCRSLFSRFDSGELITATAAAEAIGLPFPVFQFVFAHYLAAIKISGEAAGATKH